MKFTKMMVCLSTVALAVASAGSSYSVNLISPVSAGGSMLKPGSYKVEMAGDKAVFKMGKSVVEVPATMETSDHKYANTELETADSKLKEIRVGGTKMKILFSSAPVQSAEK
jgi:hypothetical protein